MWRNMKDDGYTINSLHWWAKTDSPEKYADVLRDSVKEIMYEAENGTEYDIAKVVHALYGNEFVFVSFKPRPIWYHYQDNRWVEVEDGYTLSIKISEDLTTEFMRLSSLYQTKAITKSGQERDTLMKKVENLMNIQKKLKKTGFKNSLLEQCKYKATFYN
jgi:hypothetical protein